MDGDAQVRARIMGHWQASEQGDSAAEHAIYAADAILDYPQSGERFRGRATIAAQRRPSGEPALHRAADHRRRGPMGERVRDQLRRRALPLGEHHGVLRWPRRP